MRRKLLAILAVSVTIVLVDPIAFGAVKTGTTCSKLGQTSTSAGIKYTCILSGKKLVWNNGVAIKIAEPASTTPLETKVESKNSLATDSRITPTSALTALDTCKTVDMTPDQYDGGVLKYRNGFPRPSESVYGKKVAKILVIPIEFNDLPFRFEKIQRGQVFSSDLDMLKETIPYVEETYQKLSASRFKLQIDVLPQSEWWKINIDNPLSDAWGVENFPKISEIITKYKSNFKFENYDSFVFLTGNGMPGQRGVSSAQAAFSLSVKNSTSGSISAVLIAGSMANSTLWVHELGHALFSLEDLYLFNATTSNTSRERAAEISVPSRWDLMSDSTRSILLGWNKLLMGFLFDSEVRCISEQKSTVHYLSGVSTSKDPKLLTINLAPGVTLAAEAKYGSGTDLGLLLYTINTYIPHGEGPILTQNSVIPKGQTKSWLGWDFTVIDVNSQGILFSATKTDVNKFVPPAQVPGPPPSSQRQTSKIVVGKGDILANGYLKGRATWEVTGHQSYRLYVTAVDDFQKVYFETGYVNDSRNPLVIDISGLVCNKELRTVTEFFSEKDGKGERMVIESKQLSNLSCDSSTKQP